MKNTSKLVTTLCEIGIFAALGFVFDELQGILFKSVFPSGGSIGIAMIAVLIIAYRRGLWPALLTGLIMGLFAETDLSTLPRNKGYMQIRQPGSRWQVFLGLCLFSHTSSADNES